MSICYNHHSSSKMFPSSSLRLYTSENVDNLVQRKPGTNLSRKPFLDRSVNSKTPDTGKLLKPKPNITKEIGGINKPKKSPKDDLNAEEYMFSFKDVEDTYEDVWLKPQRLTTENLVKILYNYCNVEVTPPPSPQPIEIDPIFFELPDVEEPQLLDDGLWNKTFDVEMPDCSLDISI